MRLLPRWEVKVSAVGQEGGAVDDDAFDDEAAYMLGRKVLEMAERVRPVNKAAPGAQAVYGFNLDGVSYRLTLVVRND
jgi:hypothetical protein